ncbi:MAG TPA: hypothetical protein VF244_03140 [Acidimicrobiales bacterium]
MRSHRRRRLGTATVLVILVVLVACGGKGGSDDDGASGQSSTPDSDEPVAALALAAMDERSSHADEYRDLLATLQERCIERPNRIADAAVDAQRRMADHARVESMAFVLRAMIDAIPPGNPPTDCSAVAVGVARQLAP